jgi:hypothetical protein
MFEVLHLRRRPALPGIPPWECAVDVVDVVVLRGRCQLGGARRRGRSRCMMAAARLVVRTRRGGNA